MRKEISEENLTSSCLSRYDAIPDILDKRPRSSLSLSRKNWPSSSCLYYVRAPGRRCSSSWRPRRTSQARSPCAHVAWHVIFFRRTVRTSFDTSSLSDINCARHRMTTQCTRNLTRHRFGIPTVRGFDATLGAVGYILGKVRPWREGVLKLRA